LPTLLLTINDLTVRHIMNKLTLRRSMLAAAFCTALPAVFAQAAYPNKPIRIVVPFTPAGTSDILARAVGQELSKAFGQSVTIENVPGAGGSLGSERVAKAAPDGYTLLMGHIGTHAVNPLIYPKLPYDPVKNFAPVAWVANVPNVLAINPSIPAKTLKEFEHETVSSAASQSASGHHTRPGRLRVRQSLE
jgi:tripartite-type tricarboxylate transporter receptor subunit TctC